MPNGYPAPAPYGRAPVIPPWLMTTLVVGGGLAAGALISRTALAAVERRALPVPTPTPSKEPMRLAVALMSDPQTGQITAGWTSTDPRFQAGNTPQEAHIRATLPVRVLVSLPEGMSAYGADAGTGTRLLAGAAEQSKDFVFSIDEYAVSDMDAGVSSDDYSVLMTVQFTPQLTGMMVQVPLLVYAFRPV